MRVTDPSIPGIGVSEAEIIYGGPIITRDGGHVRHNRFDASKKECDLDLVYERLLGVVSGRDDLIRKKGMLGADHKLNWGEAGDILVYTNQDLAMAQMMNQEPTDKQISDIDSKVSRVSLKGPETLQAIEDEIERRKNEVMELVRMKGLLEKEIGAAIGKRELELR